MTTTPVTKRNLRKSLVLALSLGALIALAWYIKNHASLNVLIEQEQQIRNAIASAPLQSFITGFGVYLALSLVPGTGGKAIIYGWLFGFWQALTIVTVGLTIAGMLIFYLSRFLFQETIERRYPRFLSLMNKHIEREGAFYLLTLRMAHAPYSIVNPVSGASRVGGWTFFWTTLIGLLPANAIWVYVGLRLPSLQELALHGAKAFIDWPLMAALIACGLLTPVVRLFVAKFGIPGEDVEVYEETHKDPGKETS